MNLNYSFFTWIFKFDGHRAKANERMHQSKNSRSKVFGHRQFEHRLVSSILCVHGRHGILVLTRVYCHLCFLQT